MSRSIRFSPEPKHKITAPWQGLNEQDLDKWLATHVKTIAQARGVLKQLILLQAAQVKAGQR